MLKLITVGALNVKSSLSQVITFLLNAFVWISQSIVGTALTKKWSSARIRSLLLEESKRCIVMATSSWIQSTGGLASTQKERVHWSEQSGVISREIRFNLHRQCGEIWLSPTGLPNAFLNWFGNCFVSRRIILHKEFTCRLPKLLRLFLFWSLKSQSTLLTMEMGWRWYSTVRIMLWLSYLGYIFK